MGKVKNEHWGDKYRSHKFRLGTDLYRGDTTSDPDGKLLKIAVLVYLFTE